MLARRMLAFVLLMLTLFAYRAYPQRPSPSPSLSPTPAQSPTREYTVQGARAFYSDPRSSQETQLGWGVLGFGLLIIALEIGVMLRLKKGWGTQSIRITGISLVIVAGLFLIVTGYSQEQIAPMIGLLGTIVGFLLGKTASPKESE